MLMACHLLYFIRQSKKSMKNKMIIVCVLLGLVLPAQSHISDLFFSKQTLWCL